eukprot:symbB.v1.2.032143.t1/scaffold3818.1/size49771/2
MIFRTSPGRGFELIHGGRLMTLFSASKYGGVLQNHGAVAVLRPGQEQGPAFFPSQSMEETEYPPLRQLQMSMHEYCVHGLHAGKNETKSASQARCVQQGETVARQSLEHCLRIICDFRDSDALADLVNAFAGQSSEINYVSFVQWLFNEEPSAADAAEAAAEALFRRGFSVRQLIHFVKRYRSYGGQSASGVATGGVTTMGQRPRLPAQLRPPARPRVRPPAQLPPPALPRVRRRAQLRPPARPRVRPRVRPPAQALPLVRRRAQLRPPARPRVRPRVRPPAQALPLVRPRARPPAPHPAPRSPDTTFTISADSSDLSNCCVVGEFFFDLFLFAETESIAGSDFEIVLTKGSTSLESEGNFLDTTNQLFFSFSSSGDLQAQGTWTVTLKYSSDWKGEAVVRDIVIPETRERRCAMVELFEGGPKEPVCLMSHWWGHSFMSLVEAIMGHASGQLLPVENLLSEEELKKTYWLCIFGVNQHVSICGTRLTRLVPGSLWRPWRDERDQKDKSFVRSAGNPAFGFFLP